MRRVGRGRLRATAARSVRSAATLLSRFAVRQCIAPVVPRSSKGDCLVPIAVTAVLFIFWIVMAYRQLQRGDLLLAVVFLAVGVVLSIYRLRLAKKKTAESSATKTP